MVPVISTRPIPSTSFACAGTCCSLAWPILYPIWLLCTFMGAASYLAQPALTPDLNHTYAIGCWCPAWQGLPPALALVLTRGSCDSMGDCPLYPYQGCSQPWIWCLPGRAVIQRSKSCYQSWHLPAVAAAKSGKFVPILVFTCDAQQCK